MHPIIIYVLSFLFICYLIIVLLEWIINRKLITTVIQLLALALGILILRITVNYPFPRVAFGGVSPMTGIITVFVCSIIGIMASYFFHLKKKFSWIKFLKPLLISPMLLLPLIGSIQGNTTLDEIQFISFAILAFQNGFFWKEFFENLNSN